MKNQIKMYSILLTLAVMISSCATVIDMGKINMIANRNVSTKENYVLLKNYAGGSKKEIKKALKKTQAATIDAAIDETVKNVAGGEFIMNAHLYCVKKKKKFSFFFEGDVWGLSENVSFRGFKVGDTVQWKELTVTKKGVITGLTDSEKCMVKEEGKENSQSLKYSSITKVNK